MHKRATPALGTCAEPIVNPQYVIPPPPLPHDEELFFKNDAKSKVTPIVINAGPYSDSGSGFSSPICPIIQADRIWRIKDASRISSMLWRRGSSRTADRVPERREEYHTIVQGYGRLRCWNDGYDRQSSRFAVECGERRLEDVGFSDLRAEIMSDAYEYPFNIASKNDAANNMHLLELEVAKPRMLLWRRRSRTLST
jgi:hypothetical protein